jgi:hypothetical protein
MVGEDVEYLPQRRVSATPGGYYWWAYAAYFAVAAAWSVWPAVAAFAAVAFVMRAVYYFTRSGDVLDSIAVIFIVGALVGLPLGTWRAYEHGELLWFLLLIPGVLVGDAILGGTFYAVVFGRLKAPSD